MNGRITEQFTSIQGEGLLIGRLHHFIRFSGCNLNCSYCDTDTSLCHELSADEVLARIEGEFHEVSLTGGEPMLQADFAAFIAAQTKSRVMLETNGTIPEKLSLILPHIDYVSMDLKPFSGKLIEQQAFAEIACRKKLFFKCIVKGDADIEEYADYIRRFEKYRKCELYLQPETSTVDKGIVKCRELFKALHQLFPGIRILPQVHRLMGVK